MGSFNDAKKPFSLLSLNGGFFFGCTEQPKCGVQRVPRSPFPYSETKTLLKDDQLVLFAEGSLHIHLANQLNGRASHSIGNSIQVELLFP